MKYFSVPRIHFLMCHVRACFISLLMHYRFNVTTSNVIAMTTTYLSIVCHLNSKIGQIWRVNIPQEWTSAHATHLSICNDRTTDMPFSHIIIIIVIATHKKKKNRNQQIHKFIRNIYLKSYLCAAQRTHTRRWSKYTRAKNVPMNDLAILRLVMAVWHCC